MGGIAAARSGPTGRWALGALVLLVLCFAVTAQAGPDVPTNATVANATVANATVPAEAARPVTALYAQIDAAISPAQADYLDEVLAAAAARRADLVLLRLDTPGGLAESMRGMVKSILNAPLPVVIWVGPSGARAASAGVFLVAASDVAAMSPQTSIGAASPVGLGGEDLNGTLAEKVKNDMLALVRGVAQAHGRNVQWYERAVTEAVSVTAAEALELKVIDLVATGPDDLLRQIGERGIASDRPGKSLPRFGAAGHTLVEHEPGWRYRLLGWLLDPQIAYFLLLGGMAGLFFELTMPGAVLPGVIGGVCLLLGLYAMSVLPTSVTGLLLILFAGVLFILELSVVSYGLLAVSAIICLFVGSVLLFPLEGGGSALPYTTIAITVAGTAAILGLGLYAAARAQLNRPAQGLEALVGARGRVESWQNDAGQIFVAGELWRAVTADGTPLAPGTAVTVTAASGLTLTVRPASAPQGAAN